MTSELERKRAFAASMNLLCAGFRVEPTEALLEFYWEALGELPPEAVRAAVKRAAKESQKMPSAAELRKLAPKPETRYLPGTSIPGLAETKRQLESVSTCARHRDDPGAEISPRDFVPWCHRCERFKQRALAAVRGEQSPALIGSVVTSALARIGGRR